MSSLKQFTKAALVPWLMSAEASITSHPFLLYIEFTDAIVVSNDFFVILYIC